MSDPIAIYGVAAFVVADMVSRAAFPRDGLVVQYLTFLLACILLLLPLYSGSSTVDLMAFILGISILRLVVNVLIRNDDTARTVATFLLPLLAFLVLADSRIVANFNTSSRRLVVWLFGSSRAIDTASAALLNNLCVYIAGGLLATVGANPVVRLVLRKLDLTPIEPRGQIALISEHDAGRGRAIGYLERAIVFGLVLSGHVASIGFVLAAKAFTRFRELDSRQFAEYVLVGTLLSVGLAAAIAGVFAAALA